MVLKHIDIKGVSSEKRLQRRMSQKGRRRNFLVDHPHKKGTVEFVCSADVQVLLSQLSLPCLLAAVACSGHCADFQLLIKAPPFVLIMLPVILVSRITYR